MFWMQRSCPPVPVFPPPHFIKSGVDVNASVPPCVSILWLGVCKGMLSAVYFLLQQILFLSQLISFWDITRFKTVPPICLFISWLVGEQNHCKA